MRIKQEKRIPKMTPGECRCVKGPPTWKGTQMKLCYEREGARIRGKC